MFARRENISTLRAFIHQQQPLPTKSGNDLTRFPECSTLHSVPTTPTERHPMTNYLYITEFGDVLTVELSDNTLLDLQTLVGGYIECVTANPRTLGFSADVWVNEEGLFQQGFAINFLASYITGRQIVGPAVIANVTSEGNTIGLTKQQMARVRKDGMMVDDNNGRNFIVAEAANLRFGAEVIA